MTVTIKYHEPIQSVKVSGVRATQIVEVEAERIVCRVLPASFGDLLTPFAFQTAAEAVEFFEAALKLAKQEADSDN